MGNWKRIAVAMLAAALAPAVEAGWLDRDDPLLDPFVESSRYDAAALSPSGRYLAIVRYSETEGVRVEMNDLDANTARLLPPVERSVLVPASGRFARRPAFARRLAWIDDGLLAVDFTVRGAPDVGLVFTLKGDIVGPAYTHYRGTIRADGETRASIVVTDGLSQDLQRAGVDDWKLQPLSPGLPAGRVCDWRVDASGLVRIVRTCDKAADAEPRYVTWYRKAEREPWQKVDDRSVADDTFLPVAVTDFPDRIVVQSHNGGDRMAIWNYDVARHAFLDSVASQPDADVVVRDEDIADGAIAAVVADGLRPHTVWLDARMSRLQAAVDAALPDHVNLLQAGRARRVLVRSSSDVDPGHLYVLDTETSKMQDLATRQPDIAPARMQPRRMLQYASFDGLSIPAYLTMPGRPSRPVPTVVLIHGGPWERDRWEWDAEVQLLAAHGYAVFQPQFRGSTGFGSRLEEAGYGQWGLGMQDDITAGVHWLVDQHIADPQRVCIVGASYGGYAALWGLAKTPELYRCGVSVAGVSDIRRRLSDDSDTSKSDWARAILKRRVGDPASMKETWDSVSPLKHVDRIRAPLLLVHGDADVRVPISHGALMLEAMQEQHKDVEWIDFPGEGHPRFTPANQRRYYVALLKLLERTIGKAGQ